MTTPSQVADALEAAAHAIRTGLPADSVYVADRVVVLANPYAADRWRHRHGETFAGLPLDVVAARPVETVVTMPGLCRCGAEGCSDAGRSA